MSFEVRIKVLIFGILVIIAGFTDSALCSENINAVQGIPRSLNSIISVNLNDVTLEEALKVISEKGGFQINYNRDRIPLTNRITITRNDASAIDALSSVLNQADARIHFTKEGQIAVLPAKKKGDAKGSIAGVVFDSDTGENLIGVSIELLGYRRGAVTDINGEFKIPGIITGDYSLRIRCIGYETRVIDNIRVNSSSKVSLEIGIAQQPIKLREVVVTPATFAIMETESSARQSLTRNDIETVSQFGEDIYRAVNHLPGMATDEFSAHLNIRGGEQDEILVMLDGVELHEPFHVKDINDGALSIIDAEVVEGIDLMTGGFTAEYGNCLSGVFNITTREPRTDLNTFSVGLSMMNLRLKSEGTYDDGQGSWFLSARRGYLDVVFNIMRLEDAPQPKYYDILFTTRYQLNPRHTLSIGRLYADDDMYLDEGDDSQHLESGYGNSYYWLSLKSLINQKLCFNTLASMAKVNRDRFGFSYDYFNVRVKDFELTEKRSYRDVTLKQNWSYELNNRLFLKWGLETKQLSADYDYHNFRLLTSVNDSGYLVFDSTHIDINLKKYGHSFNSYISSRIKLMDPMIVEFGLRYDRYSYSNDEDLSPRINGMYRLGENSIFRWGWGKYYQAQGIHELNVEDGKTKFWRSQMAEHWTAGFEHLFPNQVQLRLEGYYKNYSRLRPAYRNWDTGVEFFSEIEEERMEVFSNSRSAKGIEIFAKRDNGEPISFWASYSLAFAEEIIDSIHFAEGYVGAPYSRKNPSPYDQRHTFCCNLNYRPNPSWTINLSWLYHTGWPYTDRVLVLREAPNGDLYYGILPDSLHADRLPAFHRLNLRITKSFKTSSGNVKVFLELINLYNRGNIFAYDTYDLMFDSHNNPYLTREPDYWFRLLPSIGISWNGHF